MSKPPFLLNRRRLILGASGLLAAWGLAQLPFKGENAMSTLPPDSSGSPLMPTLFIGHGSPMNAIENNRFTQRLETLGRELPRPKAILCVSAHWLSAGTWVTHMENPRTIHDFYGFPQALFEMQYPAPGSPQIAEQIQALSTQPKIQADDSAWGLDHGTWAVLCKMFPAADIPVLQLSIDMSEPPAFHFELGKTLKALRSQGILIVGSGNIVHNLRRIDWNNPQGGFDWALEFDEWAKERLLKREFQSLITDFNKTTAAKLSVPTPDHYLPLLYVLGAANESDVLNFEYEGCEMGSISMRCLSFGKKS